MNTQNLKTELQSVLDSDLALRKEFTHLKRSLSDYRNQLIERDEDCKRLQVTIDVLNTKMVVMERDNVNYKAELASFKELRSTIKEQLQSKQEEIENYVREIDSLKSQLDTIANHYDTRLENGLKASAEELENTKNELNAQIEEIRSSAHYREIGVRDECEQKINELTQLMAEKEMNLLAKHESEITAINTEFNAKLEELTGSYETKLNDAASLSTNHIDSLTNEYEGKLKRLEDSLTAQINENKTSYEYTVSSIQSEATNKNKELVANYEKQLNDLMEMADGDIEKIKSEYEERLSNTLIHSNEQNSKLTEDLNKFVLENEHFKEKIREMIAHIDEQNTKIEGLSREVEIKNDEINSWIEKYNTLNAEFEGYKSLATQSQDEQMLGLNTDLGKHAETIAELKAELESKNNVIAELNSSVSSKSAELGYTKSEIERLNSEISKSLEEWNEKETSFESFKNELEVISKQQIAAKDVEFEKLLAENSNLINEIDLAQDKVEAQEEELALLKSEVSESSTGVEGRVSELKETINAKNFELTTLTADNAGLSAEVTALKAELAELNAQLENAGSSNEWESKYNSVTEELNGLRTAAETHVGEIVRLNSKIKSYESELSSLKESPEANTEQQEYIDRLFKQIDELNQEKLNLLNEKGQMAEQLLKMNDVVSDISQHVDSQNIDVSDLNNQRKNIILAKSSSGITNEGNPMKKQINELVREIDKCIALLSA